MYTNNNNTYQHTVDFLGKVFLEIDLITISAIFPYTQYVDAILILVLVY